MEALGLSPFLVRTLASLSISAPTPIQAACIPPTLQGGRDIVASSATGSGKTLAFALPILERLANDPVAFFGLVLTPTRELAYQIAEQFKAVGASIDANICVITGGRDMLHQAKELKQRPSVVIATPGRLVDLLRSNEGEVDFSRLRFFVLDEADRLLTPSFGPDLAFLVPLLPPRERRQTLLYTATMTPSVLGLLSPKDGAKEGPFVFLPKEEGLQKLPAKLKHFYLFIPSTVRHLYLLHFLLDPRAFLPGLPPASDPSIILFVSHRTTASLLSTFLSALPEPVKSVALHSGMLQAERLKALESFRAGRVKLLIATDVAARGLDIPQVEIVLHYSPPGSSIHSHETEGEGGEEAKADYVHRAGRTARAGRAGTSLVMVSERDGEVEALKAVERGVLGVAADGEASTSATDEDEPKKGFEEIKNTPELETAVLERWNDGSMALRMAKMEVQQQTKEENAKKGGKKDKKRHRAPEDGVKAKKTKT